MGNRVYKLRYLPLFVSDMEEILDYFMFNFKNPDLCGKLYDLLCGYRGRDGSTEDSL